MHKKYFKVRRIGDSIRISIVDEGVICETAYLTDKQAMTLMGDLLTAIKPWVEISSVVDGMVMVEEIDEEVKEVT